MGTVPITVLSTPAITNGGEAGEHPTEEFVVGGADARIDDVGPHTESRQAVPVRLVEGERCLVDAIQAPGGTGLSDGADLGDNRIGLNRKHVGVPADPLKCGLGDRGGEALEDRLVNEVDGSTGRSDEAVCFPLHIGNKAGLEGDDVAIRNLVASTRLRWEGRRGSCHRSVGGREPGGYFRTTIKRLGPGCRKSIRAGREGTEGNHEQRE